MRYLLAFVVSIIFFVSCFQSAIAAPGEREASSIKIKQASYTHVVKKGDSLYSIAAQYHVKLDDLRKSNIKVTQRKNSVIYIGEKLIIPNTEAMTGFEREVLVLINQERAKRGLAALKGDYGALNRAARIKSEDMAGNNYFSHTSPTLGTPFEMMRNMNVSYKAAAENIAAGQSTPASVVNAWMNSAGHKANILNASYTYMGVGYAINNGGSRWVTLFVQK